MSSRVIQTSQGGWRHLQVPRMFDWTRNWRISAVQTDNFKKPLSFDFSFLQQTHAWEFWRRAKVRARVVQRIAFKRKHGSYPNKDFSFSDGNNCCQLGRTRAKKDTRSTRVLIWGGLYSPPVETDVYVWKHTEQRRCLERPCYARQSPRASCSPFLSAWSSYSFSANSWLFPKHRMSDTALIHMQMSCQNNSISAPSSI